MRIYPVVHMKSADHAVGLASQALEVGADGVFLIDHQTYERPDILTETYKRVRAELGAGAWIGVNYLALDLPGAMLELQTSCRDGEAHQYPNGLWIDDVMENGAMDYLELKRSYRMDTLQVFGGVAFKYTPGYTDDPEVAAGLAWDYANSTDVVTTSGAGTGRAAKEDKVAAMKRAIGDQPLALASGVSVENIDMYRPYVDAVLAASSVETHSYSGEFVASKLQDLVAGAHEL